jgi:hypothetical protein
MTMNQMTASSIKGQVAQPIQERSDIVAFNFTWAMTGGAWIRRANNDVEWLTFDRIIAEASRQWLDRAIAKQGQFTGCWVTV